MIPGTARAVFISYRREETRHIAGRLADRMTERLGSTQVFMDVDTIEPGADFAAAITREVAGCDVLIALIGPTWSTITDRQGRRRLDDPDDYVTLEIQAALERDIRVIPVLVDGAAMPDRDDLPNVLQSLTRRNAVRLDHETFRSDVGTLLDAVEQTLSGLATRAETEPTADDEELFTFMDAWARPAYEAAKTLLGLAIDTLRGQDDLLKRDLAIAYQRADDDAARAYSLAFNAARGLNGSPSPQAAVGDFHREYQGMVTWIGKGFEHAALDSDSFWYREWYKSDARFMDELRRAAARPERSALRKNLRAAGFNEGVRHKLPAPEPRG